MNKIILLGNVTRNPKTTRKKSEDGTDIVITKFDLVYWLLGGYRTIIIQPKREAKFMDLVSLQKRLSLHRRKVRKNRQIKKVIFHLLQMRINHSMAGR